MKLLRCIAIVLPIFLAAAGCGRKEATRVVAPPPAQELRVVEAHWVFEHDALEGAVQLAASSPLVRQAYAGIENVRLRPVYNYAVRAVGAMSEGSRIGATILPYMVDDDPAHALFISLLDRDGKQVAEASELILGREPTSLETGFLPVRLGDQIGWIKEGSAYLAGGGGAAGVPLRSSERFKWGRFITCLLTGAGEACATGAAIGETIAPGFPASRAIGCGLGVAVLAIGCAAGSM